MKPMRRTDRQTTELAALEVLRDCDYAVLATIDAADGSPYCVPIGPVLKGRCLYFHCAPEGEKLDNLACDARVCVTCAIGVRQKPETLTTLYRSAVARGIAGSVDDPQEKRLALRLLCEKYAPSALKDVDKTIDNALSQLSVYKILITEITGKENPPIKRNHSL